MRLVKSLLKNKCSKDQNQNKYLLYHIQHETTTYFYILIFHRNFFFQNGNKKWHKRKNDIYFTDTKKENIKIHNERKKYHHYSMKYVQKWILELKELYIQEKNPQKITQ